MSWRAAMGWIPYSEYIEKPINAASRGLYSIQAPTKRQDSIGRAPALKARTLRSGWSGALLIETFEPLVQLRNGASLWVFYSRLLLKKQVRMGWI